MDSDFVGSNSITTTLLPSPIRLRLFDGSSSSEIVSSTTLSCTFPDGSVHSIEFFVTKLDSSVSAVLGYSWLTRTNPRIDWASSQLTFTVPTPPMSSPPEFLPDPEPASPKELITPQEPSSPLVSRVSSPALTPSSSSSAFTPPPLSSSPSSSPLLIGFRETDQCCSRRGCSFRISYSKRSHASDDHSF